MEFGDNKSIDNKSNDLMKIWSKDEKRDLLKALQAYGSKDLNKIYIYIPTKTPDEINSAINYYKEKTLKQINKNSKKPLTKRSVNSQIPLAIWAKLLTDSLCFKELHTEMSTALRVIADCGEIPPPSETENVDFRKIYHAIADAIDGKPLQEDSLTGAILNYCFVKTAMFSKELMANRNLVEFVNSLHVSNLQMDNPTWATTNYELTILRQLIAQKAYNPLNIPENFLNFPVGPYS